MISPYGTTDPLDAGPSPDADRQDVADDLEPVPQPPEPEPAEPEPAANDGWVPL